MEEAPFFTRTAKFKDFALIDALNSSKDIRYFGIKKRDYLDEKVVYGYATQRIAVRVNKEANELIGFAEFANFPKMDALFKNCWPDWLKHHYCIDVPLSPTNTLFFNYFIYCDKYNPKLLKAVLSELFYCENMVRYVIVLENPSSERLYDKPRYDLLKNQAHVIYPKVFDCKTCKNTQRVHIIYREEIIPKLRYRLALTEDNDDVVKILDTEYPDEIKKNGEFYIAEELLRFDNSPNILIVAEKRNSTVGFMWLDNDVNIMSLVKNFELEMYNNLVKLDLQEPIMLLDLDLYSTERRAANKLFTYSAVQKVFDISPLRKCFHWEEISTFTFQSYYKICLTSNCSFSAINSMICQSMCKKLQRLTHKMLHTNYYIAQRPLIVPFYYNVPYGYDPKIDPPHPPDLKRNAFLIKFLAFKSIIDKRELFQCLGTAFNAYPDHDYCIIATPITNHKSKSKEELLKYFTRIVPRPNCTIRNELYITHRSVIYGEVSLHTLRHTDVSDIKDMLTNSLKRRPSWTSSSTFDMYQNFSAKSLLSNNNELDIVEDIIDFIFNNPETDYKCYTIRCGNSVKPASENVLIGFIILRQFKQIHLLRKHFMLPVSEEHKSLSRAELITVKLHPLFHHLSDNIFRELALVSGFWDFYYFSNLRSTLKALSNDVANKMQPIEPLRLKKTFQNPEVNIYPRHSIAGMTPNDLLNDTFAAYKHNLRSSRHFGAEDTIVIIGFSEVCRAFLRLLVFNWNAPKMTNTGTFCCIPHWNVIVVARPGVVEAEYDDDFYCMDCADQRQCWVNTMNCNGFVRDTLLRIDLRKWIHFINGRVNYINRDKKAVILDTSCEIPYDRLLLLCETDYGLPVLLRRNDNPPSNYAHVNNRHDKILLYYKMKIIVENQIQPAKWLIYGAHFHTFEFINFLLKHDIPAKSITLVIPCVIEKNHLQLIFNIPFADRNIEFIEHQILEDLGITILENWNFSHWMLCDDEIKITTVIFNGVQGNEGEELILDCDIFISYHEFNLSGNILHVLRASDIELKDDHILVNTQFETNDPNIYSIGKCIIHDVELNYQYQYVSAMEMAEKLCYVLQLETSTYDDYEERYSKPNYFQAYLPLDYFFIKVVVPKRYLANHLTNDYNQRMLSYDGNFCRIRLNEFDIVEEIVYVTKKMASYDFLQFFCGKHEKLLNNLKSRWYLNEIENFIDFFQEPWSKLLMSDHFEELHASNVKTMLPAAQHILKFDVERRERYKRMQTLSTAFNINLEMDLVAFVLKHINEFGLDNFQEDEQKS